MEVFYMNRIEEIINRIKEGEELLIACSMYEITIWYENGIFKSTFENGYQCILDEKTEKFVIKRIVEAFNEPEDYDLYIGDDDLLASLKEQGD